MLGCVGDWSYARLARRLISRPSATLRELAPPRLQVDLLAAELTGVAAHFEALPESRSAVSVEALERSARPPLSLCGAGLRT